jgi:twinkle protein
MLRDRLSEVGIKLSNYGEGSHKCLCPQCSHTRKHKSDPCLSVTIDEDGCAYHCHNCGWSGGVKEGDDRREPARPRTRHRPDASKLNLSSLPPAALHWFAARGISARTLAVAGVKWSRQWFAEGGDTDCIAFPYRKPGGEVVNAKFRTLDKQFRQMKDGEKLFWGIDWLDFSVDAVVIVEGECDALALMEAGVDNALSVPDGAPKQVKDGEIDPAEDVKFSYVWTGKEELDRFAKIVLACDADGPGQALTEELARRLGRERCWLVTWPDGCKDANDVLMKHGAEALARCIAEAKPHPIKNLFEVDQFESEVIALYRGGRKRGISTGWREVDQYMTIRPGELSIVTGLPGSGKSEWLDALWMNLAQREQWRFAVCSFENPPDEHIGKLAEKLVGAPFYDGPKLRMSESDLRGAMGWLKQHFFLIRADDESPTIDWVLEKARAAVMRYGVKGLGIDPHNEVEHKRPAGVTETEYVSQILAKLKRFAQAHGVHVWYVAHPQKMRRDDSGKIPVPTLYDISGSSHFVNKADLGIVVSRDWAEGSNDVEIHVKKVRFKSVGKVGIAYLKYERSTGTYYESAQQQSMASHWSDREGA